jgi:D-aminopeptidase
MATGRRALRDSAVDGYALCHAAAACLARAIARAVHAARTETGDTQPVWRARFG